MKKIILSKTMLKTFIVLLSIVNYQLFTSAANAAAKRGSAIVTTASKATIREAVDGSERYEGECYNAYYSCMDQFCISPNDSGGTCICSANYSQYDSKMKEIEKNLDEANRISTVEVEKIQAGANADILFTGTREYDRKGNVTTAENQKAARRKSIEELFAEDIVEEEEVSLEDMTGTDLYNRAREICLEQVTGICTEKDLTMQTQRYLTQVRSDCTALSKNIDDLLKKSQTAILDAQRSVRTAREEQHEKDNEYNRGTCMVEFKKCMMGPDACDADWGRCASSVAAENMQNNSAKSVAGTKAYAPKVFELTESTREMLESKRNICEGVLDKCLASRQYIWDDFLRDVAPELKIAEAKLESNKRQSCLTDISTCIQRACKDDIAGKGTETMDSCLAHPDMARSFCKIEIDPCERMEPQIWDYVKSKLAALRVDACTEEVKSCYQSEDRCGSDFTRCIGMDFKYIHEMCPVDKLVVCKQSKKDFKLEDVDQMLMGFFLNVDNALLEVCSAKIDEKMEEICGSTTDCNRFAADDVIGTASLQSVKDVDVYRISGMLSFGMINMGDGVICDGLEDGERCSTRKILEPGHIGIGDYLKNVRDKNPVGANEQLVAGIIDSIDAELRNIQGTINRTIEILESDTEIQFCVAGRDLSQINGKAAGRNNRTTARFPNLLNTQKMLIAASALRQAQNNYNKKYNEMVTKAVKDASADIAQIICHQMGSGTGGAGTAEAEKSLIAPFSIMIEVGKGIGIAGLTRGNTGNRSMGASASTKETMAGISLTNIGFNSSGTSASGNTTINTRALFTRETRNCHFCTETVTTSCKSSKSNGFFGIGGSSSSSCSSSTSGEKCEDIPM